MFPSIVQTRNHLTHTNYRLNSLLRLPASDHLTMNAFNKRVIAGHEKERNARDKELLKSTKTGHGAVCFL